MYFWEKRIVNIQSTRGYLLWLNLEWKNLEITYSYARIIADWRHFLTRYRPSQRCLYRIYHARTFDFYGFTLISYTCRTIFNFLKKWNCFWLENCQCYLRIKEGDLTMNTIQKSAAWSSGHAALFCSTNSPINLFFLPKSIIFYHEWQHSSFSLKNGFNLVKT